MKLAEALTLRADLQKRIAQIKNRLMLNAKVQEGEKPAEDPTELMLELDNALAQCEELITRINLTNSQTIDAAQPLTALLARRDCLALKTGILRDFLNNASTTIVRGTKTEIKIISTINVAKQQKDCDALSHELRELDVRIQTLNWTTELI